MAEVVETVCCSACFADSRLAYVASLCGVPSDEPCPECGRTDGRKLTSASLSQAAYVHFVRGSFVRTDFGGAPQLQINADDEGDVLSNARQRDGELLRRHTNLRVAYYGPQLWMVVEIEALRALQQPGQRAKVIADVIGRYWNDKIEAYTADIDSGRFRGPELAELYLNRADAFEELGDEYENGSDEQEDTYRRALVDLDQCLRLNPQHVYAYERRSGVYLEMASYAASRYDALSAEASLRRALDDCDTAQRLAGPDDAWVAEDNRLSALKWLSFYDPVATEWLNKLWLKGWDAAAFRERSRIYAQLGLYDEAIADLEAALRRDPGDAASFLERGHVRFALGEYQRAVADFSEVLRRDPGGVAVPPNTWSDLYAEALHERGRAYARLGDIERAVSDWEAEIHEAGRLQSCPAEKCVQEWQGRLREAGHYAGPVDGVASEKLRAAMLALARDPNC